MGKAYSEQLTAYSQNELSRAGEPALPDAPLLAVGI
jgi:hypothetical protein